MKPALPTAEYNRQWLKRVRTGADRTPSGCLIWRGWKSNNGYAETNYRGKTIRVHRQLFKIIHEWELPKDVDVCHSCDVRLCIEIKHLWAGTRKQNMQDCSKKGRACEQWKTQCDRGHPYTPENTRKWGSTGQRTCLACNRGRQRIRKGWPEELAYSMAPIRAGYDRFGKSVASR